MAGVFLIGGGRDDDQVRASHSPFVAACGGGPIVAFALEAPERWEGALRLAGAGEVRCLLEPPSADDLDGAAGVFVGGGSTPDYQEALAAWRAPADLPFAGFSAGAAVAAAHAIVGGWRLGEREVCAEEAGEDLDQLAVRDGLGLVPFAVDVHATPVGHADPARACRRCRAGRRWLGHRRGHRAGGRGRLDPRRGARQRLSGRTARRRGRG
jgi:cyanophycinase